MINLEEHVFEIDGKKFIPLEIAQLAIVESANVESKLDDAMGMIKKAMLDMNNSVNEALNDD